MALQHCRLMPRFLPSFLETSCKKKIPVAALTRELEYHHQMPLLHEYNVSVSRSFLNSSLSFLIRFQSCELDLHTIDHRHQRLGEEPVHRCHSISFMVQLIRGSCNHHIRSRQCSKLLREPPMVVRYLGIGRLLNNSNSLIDCRFRC